MKKKTKPEKKSIPSGDGQVTLLLVWSIGALSSIIEFSHFSSLVLLKPLKFV